VLWWVPAGHRPSVAEAVARLAHLKQHGPGDHAFDWQTAGARRSEVRLGADAGGTESMKGFVRGLSALLAMLCLTFDRTPAVTITGHMSVLTMSHEGSWGADTQVSLDGALQMAIARCKQMRGLKLECGGQVISIEQGWLLGSRCGTRSILSSGSTRTEAEADADRRANIMRRDFVPDLPACRYVVSVDPDGVIDGAASAQATRN
jgi:hypothetical protein